MVNHCLSEAKVCLVLYQMPLEIGDFPLRLARVKLFLALCDTQEVFP